MKRIVYVISRYYWTAICKFSAKFAVIFPKLELFVSILDKALKKRTEVLGKESVYCMLKVNKWQQKAKKLIVAMHNNEKVLKGEKKV